MCAPSSLAREKSARRAVVQLAATRSSVRINCVHVCALQPGATQIDTGEARAAQIGAGEIGLMQIRAVELGEAQVAIAQADARLARSLVLVDDEIGIGDDRGCA